MSKISTHYPALLLAAGQSTRFGSQKLLHPLPNGVPIGVQAARNLKAVFAKVVAVISPENEALRALLEAEGFEVVINNVARQGMGTSLALGVASTAKAQGWIIALGDMPFIGSNTLQALGLGLEQGAAIIAPFYRGQRGHPVGFGAALGAELMALQGDKGAGGIIQRESARLMRLEVKDAGVLWDIDTRSAIEKLPS